MAEGSDHSTLRGSPGAQSKPMDIVPPEEATSGTLPHLLRKSLEGTLSLVPKGTEARVSHPMMGPRASHPGPCDHQKTRGALGNT
jgi:hypothetical protein